MRRGDRAADAAVPSARADHHQIGTGGFVDDLGRARQHPPQGVLAATRADRAVDPPGQLPGVVRRDCGGQCGCDAFQTPLPTYHPVDEPGRAMLAFAHLKNHWNTRLLPDDDAVTPDRKATSIVSSTAETVSSPLEWRTEWKALAARLCCVLSSLGYRESDLVSPSPQQRRPYHSRPALQGLSRHKPLASLPIYSTVPFRLSFRGSARQGRRTNETGGTHRKPKCRTQHISTNRARNLRSRSAVNPWN